MKLKQWVIYLLLVINIITVMFMCADFENMVIFHLVHISSFIIFIVNTLILIKYTDLFE